MDSDLVWEK